MLSKKDVAGTSEQDRFKISLGYATLIQGLNPYWCAFLFYSFSAVTFSTASVRLGHSMMSAQCPICPNADVAERFMSTRPGSLPWCCSELGAEQPGTWVTVLTGDMGNTFPVLFRSVAVVPVDPVGNAQRCPQVHRRHDVWVCAGGPRNGR